MKTTETQQLKIACPSCGRKLDLSDIPAFTEVECPACQQVIVVPCWYHNFLLEELLLEDGYLRLYRALDPSLDREVAVRVLSAETPAGRRGDFLEVVRHGARVVHPNVAQIYSCGEKDGEAFAVSQFVRGGNLRERIQGGSLPQPLEVQNVLQQAVEALAFAQSKGLCHGHLVPENLLLDEAGDLHITDFGLAQVLGKTQAANPYRAPEQKDDSPATASADMFSLASCIYEFATGTLPANGNLNHSEGDAPEYPSLSEAGTGVPNALSLLIGQMLSLEQSKRPASYDDLKETLKQARTVVSQLGHSQAQGGGKGHLHLHITRQPRTILLDNKRSKWRGLNLAIAVAVLILVALGGLNCWREWRKNSPSPQAPELQLPKRLQKELAQEKLAGSAEEPEQESWKQAEGESALAGPKLFEQAEQRPQLDESVLALRPRPEGLDFSGCREELKAYLEAVPEELRDVERERLRCLVSYKDYLLSKMQKMASYDADGKPIALKNGKSFKGTINFMSNEKVLKVFPADAKSGQTREIPWSALERREIWKMAAWYIALQQERGGKRTNAAIFDEYFYLMLLCDWYGDQQEFDKYAALADKIGAPHAAQLKKLYFGLEK